MSGRFGGRQHGAQGIMQQQVARYTRRLPTDTDMDAAVSEDGFAVRRRFRRHGCPHAHAPSHSLRVASRTGPTRESIILPYVITSTIRYHSNVTLPTVTLKGDWP